MDNAKAAVGVVRSDARKHAVVIGASMAGLVAGRVLSDHFRSVTVIDRDRLPVDPENRQGAPQGRHLHALLTRGQHILSRLFPGLVEDLIADGAERLGMPADVLWFQEGGYKVRFDSGLENIYMSRPLIEGHVRRRVRALPNVTFLDQCDVTGLCSGSASGSGEVRITGVTIRRRNSGAVEENLDAGLVIDAGGRGSRSTKWLEALGYQKPEQSAVIVDVGYTTRIYRQDRSLLPSARGIFTLPAPPRGKRAGALFPIEGGRWICTLAGWLGDHAPADDAGFLDFARELPARDIYNVVSRAEPLCGFITHKLPSSLRNHYERLSRFPEGYLVMGDAICSFNPVYGQGMSVASMEAQILDSCLKEANGAPIGMWRSFFRRAATAIEAPWTIAVGEDFRFPETAGPKPAGTDWINRYIAEVNKTTHRSRHATRALVQVLNLTRPPQSLFLPGIVLRVAWDRLTR